MNMNAFEFWESINAPRHVTAPMVDMSELPFRMLTRRFKSDLCYTPMFHSYKFSKEAKYRKSMFTTDINDRPLFVQFCSNDAAHFLLASQFVESSCDAIDLNLGCPQKIAKRGNYGAYIMNDWELVHDIVSTAAKNLSIPVTCKIRVFESNPLKSLQYAQMLEKSGCKVLGVHGRHIDQKGPNTKLSDWDVIRLIKQNVNIPVIANGNVLNLADCNACLTYTGADAVMSAEGLLHNPALFEDTHHTVWHIANEFLDLCKKYPIQIGHVRGHIFKLLHLCLPLDPAFREKMIQANCLEDFYVILKQIYDSLSPLHEEYIMQKDRSNFDKLSFFSGLPLKNNEENDDVSSLFTNLNDDVLKRKILMQYLSLSSCKSPYINFCKTSIDDILDSNKIIYSNILDQASSYNLSSVASPLLDPLLLNDLFLLPPWICHPIPHYV